MTSLARIVALVLLVIAPAAVAQPLFVGDPIPLADTRYGAAGAEPRLVTNGEGFFLFWATDSKIRVTRLVDGQKRAGRPVLGGTIGQFDVVWTGTHFLVAAEDRDASGMQQIRGRLVDARGEAIGAPFTIVSTGSAPRLAFDGARVLMTYSSSEGHSSILLRADGQPAADPHHQLLALSLPGDSAAGSGAMAFVAAAAHVPDALRVTMFHPTGEIADAAHFAAPPVLGRRVAIGTDGSDTLVVWTNGSGTAERVTVTAGGTIGGRATIAGTEGAVDIAVAWNGEAWVVSTIANGKLHTRLVGDGSVDEAHEPIKAHAESPVSVASLEGRTLAAWRAVSAGQPVTVRDLAASGNGVDAAFAAAEQTFQTATSSYDAALAVWSELRDGRRTLHAGVRKTDGTWRENRIGGDEEATLASSDGSLFLVVRQSEDGWSAVTLSDTAQVLAATPRIETFTPTGITWDGTSWVVIGVNGATQIFAARVTRSGVVSSPVLVHQRSGTRELENPRIAAGGGGFLAIWQDSEFQICFPVCDPYTSALHGTRLTSSLQRVDTLNLSIAPDEAVSPDLYWNGERFVIFWLDGGAVETRTMRPDSAVSGTTRIAGAQVYTGHLRVTQTSHGTSITSNDGEMLLIRNNALVRRYTLGNADSPDALVSLGEDVAYLQAFVRDEMPYHGASRIFLRTGGVIARDTLPLPPRITRAAMTEHGNLIVLEWTPPAGDAGGYRIEYRVDDGTWNELDVWIDGTQTSASIVPWLDKVKYQFRLRTWSDSGVSEYSAPATVRTLGRRRAMR